MPVSPGPVSRLFGALLLLAFASRAAASHDPLVTATVYVHGFDPNGASHVGVYGEDTFTPLLGDIAGLIGFPTIGDPGGPSRPNVIAATTYYGDTPPSYYTTADIADLDAAVAQWGGGIPLYALIVAKYARHVLERSGAQQVNFVSASLGSFVTRWLIEKDADGLASDGLIARWLSFEGVVSGNWAASQNELTELWNLFNTPSIDVAQMDYGWVAANLHAPRTEADSPLYSSILVGQNASTDDDANDRALTNTMLLYGEFQPNDGVQGLNDTYFQTMTPQSRFLGLGPTASYADVNHYQLADYRGAWAEAVAFLMGRRRVTITITRAQVTNIHEPSDPWWDWTPAEIVFESRVHSPAAQTAWGIPDPISARHRDGVSTPIRHFDANGEQQTFSHVVFDDLVLDTETALDVELWAEEIDWDARYGVLEPLGGSYDNLGGGWITLPVTASGTYSFAAADWNCDLSVQVFEYPFATITGVGENVAARRGPARLRIFPNPSSGPVHVLVPGERGAPATLSVYSAAGALVRRIRAEAGPGLVWDGRDASGRPAPAGVYFHRVDATGGRYAGKSLLLR